MINSPSLNCKVIESHSSGINPVQPSPKGSTESPPGGTNRTVGDLFDLECNTEKNNFDLSHVRALTKKDSFDSQGIPHGQSNDENKTSTEDPFQLQILKAESLPDGRLHFVVTSYRTGPYDGGDMTFTDGVHSAKVNGVSFHIESVIDPQSPPKAPFGSLVGVVLRPPPYYAWIGLGLLGFLLVAIFVRFLSYRRLRKLIEGLKQYDMRLSPQNEFHSRMRALDRKGFLQQNQFGPYLDEFEKAFRVFIIRQFRIPAFNWSDRQISNDFKSRFVFLGSQIEKDFKVVLRELAKLKAKHSGAIKDIEQLTKKIKRWVDQVDRSMVSRSSGVKL